ncbi:MAG TPA: hypothetical protein VFJ98_06400 [Mycobacteriales bacterium]|nr:hypothetical protein [Mycobacteriales bacterium]
MTEQRFVGPASDNPYAAPPVATATDRQATQAQPRGAAPPPLYWRVLRLQHVRPNGWQRAVLVEGVIALAVTLVLADVATAWTLLVLPLATAAVVKGHDVLAGWLPVRRPVEELPPPRLADYGPVAVVAVALLLIGLL